MRFRLSDARIAVAASVITLLAAVSSVALPKSPITFVFMIPFFFFLPGYALTRLIFRKSLEFDVLLLTSVALSVIVSIALAAVMLLTPIGLSQIGILVAIVAVTLVSLALEMLMRKENRQFEIELKMPKREDIDPVVAVAIAFGLVLIGAFAYIIATTHAPSTTNVYFLSESDTLQMPTNASVGATVNFTVVMTNGEGSAAEFEVQIFNNTKLYNATESPVNTFTVSLDDNETVEHDFSVIFYATGEQLIEARVSINGALYGTLHFSVDIL